MLGFALLLAGFPPPLGDLLPLPEKLLLEQDARIAPLKIAKTNFCLCPKFEKAVIIKPSPRLDLLITYRQATQQTSEGH